MGPRLAIVLLFLTAAAVVFGSAGAARAEDLSILNGLYGYWSLDENHQDTYVDQIRDDGTFLHPAHYQFLSDADQGKNLQPQRVPGIRGQAIQFPGSSRPFALEVSLPDASPQRLTVSLWAWMDQRDDDATLFSNTALKNFGFGQFRFRVLADGINVFFGEFNPRKSDEFWGPNEVMATRTPFPLHQWEHIVLVISEPKAWLYLNGKEIGYIRLSEPLQMSVIKSVIFGAFRRRWPVDDSTDWRPGFGPWCGKIDEIAMWTRPLSDAEVRGLYAITLAGKPVFDATPIPTLWESTTLQIGVGVLAVLVAALLLHQLLTRRLRRRLMTAESLLLLDGERKRIADDIHDDLGARLAKLSMLSDMAARGGQPSTERLKRVSDTARDAARSLDELVWTLKPAHDSLNDFVDYVTNAASELLEDTGIALRLSIPDDLPEIKIVPTTRRELMLAWKESMANALKHAQATEIDITISIRGKELTISVADNGIGMPTGEELRRKRSSRNGLRTMCERVERLGGNCDLRARAGGGTAAIFSIPLG